MTPVRAAAHPAHTRRVLVVEDEFAIREIEERMLRVSGYDVVAAEDAFEALAIVRAQRFDLFLIDVMMPGMTGFELAQELRANPETARTPILFVSARGDDSSMMEGLASGSALYLVKPFTSATLLTMVRGALATAEAVAV